MYQWRDWQGREQYCWHGWRKDSEHILTAIDNIVVPKDELAIRSINASSDWDVTSGTANSESREHIGINAFFENASGSNNVQQISSRNDETRKNIPDEVSELLVPETRYDQQPHTHHSYWLFIPEFFPPQFNSLPKKWVPLKESKNKLKWLKLIFTVWVLFKDFKAMYTDRYVSTEIVLDMADSFWPNFFEISIRIDFSYIDSFVY